MYRMRKSLALILLICLVAATQNQTNRLLQITTRTASVTKMCASFSDRNSLVDDKTKADAELNKAAMKASFKLSGNQLFNSILGSSDIMSAALVQLPTMGTELGLFVGPFVLGLLIIVLIWPFLCCCCCCPSCCPSKCCQKNQDQQYTKCELIWPAVVLILALLLMIVASVIGITRSSDIEQSYKAVGCSLAITFDDVINGNTSTSGKYFIGMNGLYNTLTDLDTNLGTVNTNIQKLRISNTGEVLSQAYTEGTATLDQISKVPSGSSNSSMTAFNYPNNFDGSPGTIASTFPNLLGSVTGNSGAVNIAYTAFKQINEGLKLISDLADTFDTQLGSLPSTISQFKNSMKEMVDLVNGFDTMISGMDSTISDIMKIVTLAVTAVFGVFIGLGVLSIIGTVFMTCCDKYSCRYLVYFVCVILFVLGIFCFLLSTIFSILTPVIYFGCDFLTVSISSSTSFSANLGKTIGGQLSSYLQVCLPGGSGDIINQMQGVDLSGVSSVSDAMARMKAFDTTSLQTASLATLTSLSDFIDKYYYTDVYDFTSTSNQNFISSIANPAAQSTCIINNFQSDKWVPSLRNTAFDCSGTTKQATYSATANTQCSSTARVDGGYASDITATGCYGCMDSTKILVKLSASTPASRYAHANCATWNGKIASLKTNYIDVKITYYGPVQTRMAATLTRYNTATTGYNARLADVGTAFTGIISTLQGTLNSIFNPQYGLMAGLNCLILGQDINLIANTACAKLFNTLFLLRLALGLSGFGILFALCCSTCSGVRAFKHMNKKTSVIPDVGGMGQQNSMNALNAKY